MGGSRFVAVIDSARAAVEAASHHTSDRWLYAWGLSFAGVGAASLLVPLYALSLGGGPFVVGILEATAGLAGVPGALIWGRLADRTGQRRAFVLISLAGSGVMLAVFPALDSVGHVILANAVLWFMAAAAAPVVTLFMIEGTPERDWETRIGLLNAYQRYGWVGGLVVGAVWLAAVAVQFSPLVAQRSFFVVCAVGGLLATPLAFYWLPPAATTRSDRLVHSPRAFGRLVTGSARYVRLVPYAPGRALVAITTGGRRPVRRFSTPLRRYLGVVFVFSTAFATFFGPIPAYLDALAFSSSAIFGVFIVSSLASAVAFLPAGRRVQRTGPTTLQVQALAVRVLLFPAIGLVGVIGVVGLRWLGIGIGFALIGLTWAVVAVTAPGVVSRIAPRALRGEALGAYTAVAGVGGGIGGVLGGFLANAFGYQIAFGVAGLLVLWAILLLRWTDIVIPGGTEADAEAAVSTTRVGAEDGSEPGSE